MITTNMLGKIRRMYFRQGLSMPAIARHTGLTLTTIQRWINRPETVEPTQLPYAPRKSILDPWTKQLKEWLREDRQRPKRQRRSALSLYRTIKQQGYTGSLSPVLAFVRQWRATQVPLQRAHVPLLFEFGEAFQFDWSTESVLIDKTPQRLQVAHFVLCASRAFFLIAYPGQGQEMLFDAHARAFAAFKGIPKRGIYDNMATIVTNLGGRRERILNRGFQAMCNHYLFELQLCNVAAPWEKGIVEKNVHLRRGQIWAQAAKKSWHSLDELNTWLAQQCHELWARLRHPRWHEHTILDLLRLEQSYLMPTPAPFRSYQEKPVRVSDVSLFDFQTNHYSVPTSLVKRTVILRVYANELIVMVEGKEITRHARCFGRNQTCYDFRHYIDLLKVKPGALQNGAPFGRMPVALRSLQKQLLQTPDGERAMVQMLSAIAVHGLPVIVRAARVLLRRKDLCAEYVHELLAHLRRGSTFPGDMAEPSEAESTSTTSPVDAPHFPASVQATHPVSIFFDKSELPIKPLPIQRRRRNAHYGIQRVDDDKRGTHAWVVTIQRRNQIHHVHVTDSHHGGKTAALQEALRERDRLIATHPPYTMVDYMTIKKKANRSGTVGVFRHAKTKVRSDGRITQRWYWIAFWPIGSKRNKQKKYSIDRYGEQGAYQRAVAVRTRALSRVKGNFEPHLARNRKLASGSNQVGV